MPVRPSKQHPSIQSAPGRDGFGAARAVLIAVRRSGQPRDALRWSVAELEALAREVGIDVVYELVQTCSHVESTPLFGKGRLRELAELIRSGEAHAPRPALVLIDAVLSPREQRALEQALAIEVIDRTELILRLFAVRARTREAQLTVELARLRHALPRLREDHTKLGREGGGGRGERGNTQIALAKERTRARICALERELERVQRMAREHRARREGVHTVAIVGYTNAGKSSWLSALTGCDTLVADKPFATLDTRVRTLPQDSPRAERILVADTVGFLRDLPHELIPSFHATLEEARCADLCLLERRIG